MNRKQSNELARWLADKSAEIQYGDVSVKVLIHSGHICRIVCTITESQLPEKAIKDKKLVKTNFCGEIECEDLIKDKTEGATSRCIPFNTKPEKDAKCVHCSKQARCVIYFSKSY